MKGLAAVFGAKPAGKPTKMPMPMAGGNPAEEEAEGETGGSEMEFARIASEASAAGDHDAAAKAMVSAIKACMSKSYEE